MRFVSNLKNSLYNPRYYAALRRGKFSSSVRYYFSLITALSVIIAFVFGVELSSAFSADNLRKLALLYPEELVLQIKNGVVSSNVAEPYFIKEAAPAAPQSGAAGHENAAVIDTKNNFSAEAFKQYDAAVWVGKNFIITPKNSGQFEFTDLSRMPDFSLSRDKIFGWIDSVASHHLLISLGIFAALFFAFFGFFTLKLLGLIFIALLVFLFGKAIKAGLSYKNCYQISLHAVTAPFFLQTIFILSGLSAPFPFFFSLILLVIIFLNVKPVSFAD